MKLYLLPLFILMFTSVLHAKQGAETALFCSKLLKKDIHKSLDELHRAFHVKELQAVKELNALLIDYVGEQRKTGYADTNGETHPASIFTNTSSFMFPGAVYLKDTFSIRMIFQDIVPFDRPKNIFKGRFEPYVEEREANIVYQYTVLDNITQDPTIIEDIIVEDLTLTVLTQPRASARRTTNNEYERLQIKFNERGEVVYIEVTLPPVAQSDSLYKSKDRMMTARFLFDDRAREYVPRRSTQ